jgi:putative PEP-CTERM system histidine kinase
MSVGLILGFCCALLAAGVGLVGLLGKGRTVVQWSFLGGMLALGTEALFAGFASRAILPTEIVRWQMASLVAASFVPGTWLLFSLTYARGNYKEFLNSWKLLLLAAFLLPLSLCLSFRESVIVRLDQPGPSPGWVATLGWAGVTAQSLALCSAALVLMNLERTFRASVGTMRWRIKFMFLGLGLLFAVRIYTGSQYLLYSAMDPSFHVLNAMALVLACVVLSRSLVREGIISVDVYPSRAFLHNSLTLLLAGVYLLLVSLLARVVTVVGGDAAFPLEAFLVLVSLVLLSASLLSERVRQYTRRIVSRHFQRPHYDSRQVWTAFVTQTASLVDRGELCRAVVKLVSETFHVLSTTIWLVEEPRERFVFGASTSLSGTDATQTLGNQDEVARLIPKLRGELYPIEIDASKEKWVESLKRCSPETFSAVGNRVSVPLLARGELLGVLLVGDRVNGVPFSVEELDLLKCIGDQVAGSLLNIQLSQRLLEAKEMEAFQAMSAFFVHDLKNTVSTLSLMLQNLPTHLDKPAFREDVLRAVANSVNRLSEIICRLSLLRQELRIERTAGDLNEVVCKAVKMLNGSLHVDVQTCLHKLPRVVMDANQMQKVVINLLVNAADATGQGGEIRLETTSRNGWAVLSVADNGCGMSKEFLNRSLFRPFQTTKKQGIGIGLFLSKMIVEAHRGKIEVDSQLNRGTTFKILLPAEGGPE